MVGGPRAHRNAADEAVRQLERELKRVTGERDILKKQWGSSPANGREVSPRGACIDLLWDSVPTLALLGGEVFGFGVCRFRRRFG